MMARPRSQKFPPIGVLLSTHDRVLDAKANQEVIRSRWERSHVFPKVIIVHAYNGDRAWYPRRFLEDALVQRKNSGHYQGAADLIDAGAQVFRRRFPKIRYVVVLAADTWLIRPAVVARIVRVMRKRNLRLATCAWGLPARNDLFDVGMAVDFFIVDLPWAWRYGMFPLRYKEFSDQYAEFLLYHHGSRVMLEKVALARFLAALLREDPAASPKPRALEWLYRITEREPVHSHVDAQRRWIRKPYWPRLGLLTHHDFAEKLRILKRLRVPITVSALNDTRWKLFQTPRRAHRSRSR